MPLGVSGLLGRHLTTRRCDTLHSGARSPLHARRRGTPAYVRGGEGGGEEGEGPSWSYLRPLLGPDVTVSLCCVCVGRHSAGPPGAFESGVSLADRSPPGMVRSKMNLRRSRLRWTPPQPSKVATVSQIADPPPGMVRSNLSLRMSPLRWTPQQLSKVATVSQIAAPQGW